MFAQTSMTELGWGGPMLLSIAYFILALIMIRVGWWVIDKITPGVLADELLGLRSEGKPNVALAIVVGCMFLGVCIIAAAAIH